MEKRDTSAVSRRNFLKVAAGSLIVFPAVSAWGRETGGLIVHTEVPKNAEPPLPELVKNWMTPTEGFYIRSHGPNPRLDAGDFRLQVTGLVDRELSLSLEDLEQYEQTEIVATMTCAGNRRYEHSRTKQVEGVPWREGAIGNAEWGGVPLSAILKKAGVKQGARRVWFDGLDKVPHDGETIPFGASIPLDKAMDDAASMPGALVTTQMNGQPLTEDHGYPVRTVVPGYIGARSVKWLGKITVSDRPTSNHFIQTAYKVVREGTPLEWAEQAPIYRYPINAVIATPAAGSTVAAGRVRIAGYALSSGDADATITQVRVSADGGRNWTSARLTGKSQPYCWQLWEADVDVTPQTRNLTVQAEDSAGRRQPRRTEWNLKGYLYNASHQVPIRVQS